LTIGAQEAAPLFFGDEMKPSDLYHALVTDEWETRVTEDPLLATFTGDNRFNDRLPGMGEVDFERRMEQMRGFLGRLSKIDRNLLPPVDQLDHDIFHRLLENELQLLEFRIYRLPISKAGGFHTSFPELHLQMPLSSIEDYKNYVARLNAFKQYAEDHVEIMRSGLRCGQIPPRVTLEGVEEAIRVQIVDTPSASLLYAPFKQFPTSFSKPDRLRLEEEGSAAIRDSVIPGYAALLTFMIREYLPAARETIAAADLPRGREYYLHAIRYYTSLELTPEEIHQTGNDEVSRIKAEMEADIKQVGSLGDFRAFTDFLRTDKRFYAATPNELLEKTSLVLKRMDGELPRLFKTLPRLPYGIREIPAFSAPGNTTAYYQPGAGDGSRAGYYYVNTYDLPSRPLYEIEALSLHEAVPGHHLQIALQQELDLPNFRRFGGFTSFVEGWALYSERLGLETGFYTDPYSNFGRLSYEMWRACRLVVDTGMHALGWSRQQAIDYMMENTSSTLLNIINEVDRYIAWPGQALAYKIGELKIRELRANAEKQLGASFDLREFHDVVLTSGAVPLDVLENMVRVWVTSKKK
jgi:uncharacterized protein (DUF885 family)